jgi:PncC family amidohydrolase
MAMDEALEKIVGEKLRAFGWTLAVAESCTGGLIGHLLTNIPGSSDYFLGGIIAYSNHAKEHLIGVQRESLETFGAVSEEVALEMAIGARVRLGADFGASVTGIAGPGGDSPEKPLGLTFIAISGDDFELVRKYTWEGNREDNKMMSAHATLKLLIDALEGRSERGNISRGEI